MKCKETKGWFLIKRNYVIQTTITYCLYVRAIQNRSVWFTVYKEVSFGESLFSELYGNCKRKNRVRSMFLPSGEEHGLLSQTAAGNLAQVRMATWKITHDLCLVILSILGDIWRAIILPFSSSKYFYSCLRLKFSWSFISMENNHTPPQSSHTFAMGYDYVPL